MKKIYTELLTMRKKVTNVEASAQNLAVFERLEELKDGDGPLAEFKKYVDKFEAKFLPAEIQAQVKGRLVPFYKKLPFVEPQKIRGAIFELEKASLNRARKNRH